MQLSSISDRNRDVRSDRRCKFASGEKVEAYLAGKLSEAETNNFEDHYILCAECTDLLESTDLFIRSVRAAGEILEGSAPCRPRPQRADGASRSPGSARLGMRSTK